MVLELPFAFFVWISGYLWVGLLDLGWFAWRVGCLCVVGCLVRF